MEKKSKITKEIKIDPKRKVKSVTYESSESNKIIAIEYFKDEQERIEYLKKIAPGYWQLMV